MIGAIIGDIVGSPYEFNANNIKTTDFPLFSEKSAITDDSIMTCAVAEALFYAGNSELYFKASPNCSLFKGICSYVSLSMK